jgi:hypothetical protein
MRYEKPIVMDLSAGARAAGQGPLGCIPGVDANNYACSTGDVAYPDLGPCTSGPVPETGWPTLCAAGPAVGGEGACVGGGSPIQIEPCTVGIGPNV